MKHCSRLLIVLCQNFCQKMKNFGIWTSVLGEVRGDAWPWLMARWKANGRLPIRVNCLLWYGVMRRNVYSLAVFRRGSTSLYSNFTWTGSSPINHSWHQKTRDTGLPDAEDHIPLRSLILTQYQIVMDRRICRSKTALTKLALWHAVKLSESHVWFLWHWTSVQGQDGKLSILVALCWPTYDAGLCTGAFLNIKERCVVSL